MSKTLITSALCVSQHAPVCMWEQHCMYSKWSCLRILDSVNSQLDRDTDLVLQQHLRLKAPVIKIHIHWKSKYRENKTLIVRLCPWTCVHCVQYWCFTQSHLLVGQAEQKLPVKASRPPECWVDRVKSVSSTYDHYLPTTVQTVHQGQQSGHNRTRRREGGGQNLIHVFSCI